MLSAPGEVGRAHLAGGGGVVMDDPGYDPLCDGLPAAGHLHNRRDIDQNEYCRRLVGSLAEAWRYPREDRPPWEAARELAREVVAALVREPALLDDLARLIAVG